MSLAGNVKLYLYIKGLIQWDMFGCSISDAGFPNLAIVHITHFLTRARPSTDLIDVCVIECFYSFRSSLASFRSCTCVKGTSARHACAGDSALPDLAEIRVSQFLGRLEFEINLFDHNFATCHRRVVWHHYIRNWNLRIYIV